MTLSDRIYVTLAITTVLLLAGICLPPIWEKIL